jgi:hypothetical protein
MERLSRFVTGCMIALCVAVLLIAGIGRPCSAETLSGVSDLKCVPEDTAWIVQINWEAMQETDWFEFAGGMLLTNPEFREKLNEVREATGLNLVTDIHSVTFFGDWTEPEDCVVRIEGDLPQDRLTTLIQEAPEYREMELEGRTVHSFLDEQGHTLHACFTNPNTVIVSQQPERLAASLLLLGGEESKFAASPSPEGTILDVRAMNLADVKEEVREKMNSPIVDVIDSVQFQFGEAPSEDAEEAQWTFLLLTIKTYSEEEASDATDVARGIVAAARLHFRDQPQVIEALSLFDIEQKDETVRIRWECPTEPLIQGVQAEMMRRIMDEMSE